MLEGFLCSDILLSLQMYNYGIVNVSIKEAQSIVKFFYEASSLYIDRVCYVLFYG
jgi:hypothetical protein